MKAPALAWPFVKKLSTYMVATSACKASQVAVLHLPSNCRLRMFKMFQAPFDGKKINAFNSTKKLL